MELLYGLILRWTICKNTTLQRGYGWQKPSSDEKHVEHNSSKDYRISRLVIVYSTKHLFNHLLSKLVINLSIPRTVSMV